MTPRKLVVATWIGGLITLGSAVTVLVFILMASNLFPAKFGVLPPVSALISLICILATLGWVIGVRLGKKGALYFAAILAILLALALSKSEYPETGLILTMLGVGPFLMGWSLGCLDFLRRKGAEGQD